MMEKDTKLFLGKILGELYRIEKHTGIACPASSAEIYGLLNGIEPVIDEERERIECISDIQLKCVMDVLDRYWNDSQKMKEFKGFYDIENQLKTQGIDRSVAIKIFRYLYANSQFVELIEKMDSCDSPCECRNFKLREFDK